MLRAKHRKMTKVSTFGNLLLNILILGFQPPSSTVPGVPVSRDPLCYPPENMPPVLAEYRRDSHPCVRKEVRTRSSNFLNRFLANFSLQLSLPQFQRYLLTQHCQFSTFFEGFYDVNQVAAQFFSPAQSASKAAFLRHLRPLSPLNLLSSPHCTATISSPAAFYLCSLILQTKQKHSSVILVRSHEKEAYIFSLPSLGISDF